MSRYLGTGNFSYSGSGLFYVVIRYYVKNVLRKQPPDYVLKEAEHTNKFFKCVGSVHNLGNGGTYGGLKSAYMALTEEEFEAVSNYCFTSVTNNDIKMSIENSGR